MGRIVVLRRPPVTNGLPPVMADCALSYDAPPVSGWPLSSNLELGVLSGSVLCARLHAHHVLREWSLAALSDAVELVVSELVGNAIKV